MQIEEAVFPAGAGVILKLEPLTCISQGVSRRRGGDPGLNIDSVTKALCFPQARG